MSKIYKWNWDRKKKDAVNNRAASTVTGSMPEVPAVKLPFKVIYQKRECKNDVNYDNETSSEPS